MIDIFFNILTLIILSAVVFGILLCVTILCDK